MTGINWRKIEEEKPQSDGLYLIREGNAIGLGLWRSELQEFDTPDMPCARPNKWCPLNEILELSRKA